MSDTRTGRLILTSSAQTTDQTSEVFVVPKPSRRFALAVDVTVGSALDLKITLQMLVDGLNKWIDLVVGVPLVAISGVSTTAAMFGDMAESSEMDSVGVSVRGQLRAVVVHGNATAATYTVHLKPL